MSYITHGQEGLEKAKAKEWHSAIYLLTLGLAGGTAPPPWLLARAQAYQETGQYELALADAERAYLSALARQHPKKRDHLFAAQYRRAVVLGHLRRYADADACCVWAQQIMEGKNFFREPDDVATHVDADGEYLATVDEATQATAKMPKDKGGDSGSGTDANTVKGLPEWAQAYTMRTVMLRAMQALPKGDAGRKITVKRVPDPPTLEAPAATPPAGEANSSVSSTKVPDTKVPETKAPATKTVADPPAAQPAAPPPAKKLRVDFYQTPETVSLSLYAKGVAKENMKVDVHDTTIDLFGLPESITGSSTASLRLGGGIDPATQDVRVTPYKIELKFKKKPADVKWGDWGEHMASTASAPVPDAASAAPAAAALSSTPSAEGAGPKPTAAAPTPAVPAYPTSSRRGQKNWDAVVSAEAEDGPGEGDVNGFFKQLFASSTPEQQRAMVKSFVESNGTTLSTDWESVAKETVETKPPEGVEAKKW